MGIGTLVDWLNEVVIECINCGHEVKTDFDSIEQRKVLKCSKCGTSFLIHDVYDMYYDQVPLVRNAIDLILSYAKQPWTVTNGKAGYSEEIEAFLKKIGFDSLLGRILSDVVKYGDSYLEIIRNSKTKEITQLKPLDAKSVSIKLGKEMTSGRGYYGEREVEEFIVANGGNVRRLAPTDVIHSKSRTFLHYTPYGESVMRITLRDIHYLRTSGANAIRLGAGWWVDYLENEICLGIGVPRILLEQNYAKYQKPVVEYVSKVLTHSVREAQEPIENSFEGQLFGQVIGEKEFLEIPRLEFRKPNSAMILKNGGYDFREEIKNLEKARELGIIAEQEFERLKSEYLGKS